MYNLQWCTTKGSTDNNKKRRCWVSKVGLWEGTSMLEATFGTRNKGLVIMLKVWFTFEIPTTNMFLKIPTHSTVYQIVWAAIDSSWKDLQHKSWPDRILNCFACKYYPSGPRSINCHRPVDIRPYRFNIYSSRAKDLTSLIIKKREGVMIYLKQTGRMWRKIAHKPFRRINQTAVLDINTLDQPDYRYLRTVQKGTLAH